MLKNSWPSPKPAATRVTFWKAWPARAAVVAGAGTRQPVNKAQAFVKNYAGKASHQTADQTESVKELKHLVGEEE